MRDFAHQPFTLLTLANMSQPNNEKHGLEQAVEHIDHNSHGHQERHASVDAAIETVCGQDEDFSELGKPFLLVILRRCLLITSRVEESTAQDRLAHNSSRCLGLRFTTC